MSKCALQLVSIKINQSINRSTSVNGPYKSAKIQGSKYIILIVVFLNGLDTSKAFSSGL